MTLRPPDHVPSSLVAGKSWLAASLLALTGAGESSGIALVEVYEVP